MTRDSLLVPVGPGLVFRFDDLSATLRLRVEKYLAYYLDDPVSPSGSPIRVSAGPVRDDLPAGNALLEEPPLVVRQAGELTLFELPGILAWCNVLSPPRSPQGDVAKARGGICLDRPCFSPRSPPRGPSEAELDLFIGLALAPLLLELATSRGWLGIHAAGVAVDGAGILLPGPSGAGKSTIFTHVHRAGHAVLSDDLVWLAPAADGPRMYAFPRGAPTDSVPWPTADGVALRAIVCPEIATRGESRLSPLALPELMEVLVGQSGFLSSGAAAGDRFRALVRLGRSVPAYRLEAGPNREEIPELLARSSRSALRNAFNGRLAGGARDESR